MRIREPFVARSMLNTTLKDFDDAIKNFSGDASHISQHLRNILFGVCGHSRSEESISLGTQTIVNLSENLDSRLEPYFSFMQVKLGVRVDSIMERLQDRYENAGLQQIGRKQFASVVDNLKLRRLLLTPQHWHNVLKTLFYLQAVNCVQHVRMERSCTLRDDVVLEIARCESMVLHYGDQICLNPLWLSCVWDGALTVFCELQHELCSMQVARLLRGILGMYIVETVPIQCPLPPPPWLPLIPPAVWTAERNMSNLHLLTVAVHTLQKRLHGGVSIDASATRSDSDVACLGVWAGTPCDPLQQLRLLLMSSLWSDYALIAALLRPRLSIFDSAVQLAVFAWGGHSDYAPDSGAVHTPCLIQDFQSSLRASLQDSDSADSCSLPASIRMQFDALYSTCTATLSEQRQMDPSRGCQRRFALLLRALVLGAVVGGLADILSDGGNGEPKMTLFDACWSFLTTLLNADGRTSSSGVVGLVDEQDSFVQGAPEDVVGSALCFFMNSVDDLCSISVHAEAVGCLILGDTYDKAAAGAAVANATRTIATALVNSIGVHESSLCIFVEAMMATKSNTFTSIDDVIKNRFKKYCQ